MIDELNMKEQFIDELLGFSGNGDSDNNSYGISEWGAGFISSVSADSMKVNFKNDTTVMNGTIVETDRDYIVLRSGIYNIGCWVRYLTGSGKPFADQNLTSQLMINGVMLPGSWYYTGYAIKLNKGDIIRFNYVLNTEQVYERFFELVIANIKYSLDSSTSSTDFYSSSWFQWKIDDVLKLVEN